MSKNKLVLDLGNIPLTAKQRKALHNAIHRTVTNQLKKAETGKKSAPPKTARRATARAAAAGTANLQVTFFNTEPGDSELIATLKEESKTVNESGKIRFQNVQSGDIITIEGTSLGTTTVTIDISAEPVQMAFTPGNFADNFFIH